jgi:hypothetical protein
LVLSPSQDDTVTVAEERLTRGSIVELEVMLEPEPVFSVSATVSDAIDLLEHFPPHIVPRGLKEMTWVRQMMDALLVNLVPLRGKVIGRCVADVGSDLRVVHESERAVILRSTPEAKFYSLVVVGVAEKTLFWKDLRRVLFSDSQFRIYARVARSGIQTAWTPVKLEGVLRQLVPDFGQHVDALAQGLSRTGRQPSTSGPDRGMQVLEAYIGLLSSRLQLSVAPEDLAAITTITDLGCSLESVPDQRSFLEPATAYLERLNGAEVDRFLAAECREAALATTAPEVRSNPDTLATQSSAERFLDVEFVAIYW